MSPSLAIQPRVQVAAIPSLYFAPSATSIAKRATSEQCLHRLTWTNEREKECGNQWNYNRCDQTILLRTGYRSNDRDEKSILVERLPVARTRSGGFADDRSQGPRQRHGDVLAHDGRVRTTTGCL